MINFKTFEKQPGPQALLFTLLRLLFLRMRESIYKNAQRAFCAGAAVFNGHRLTACRKSIKLSFLFPCILFVTLNAQHLYSDEAPALPMGLGGASQESDKNEPPGLPTGLGSETVRPSGNESGPALPQGLQSEESAYPAFTGEPEKSSFLSGVTGFIEARGGMRIHDDPFEKDVSIAETRLQVEMEKQIGRFLLRNITDIFYDAVPKDRSIRLEKGKGFIDLRELNVVFSLFDIMDIKAGRQILTWGTGDLVFINDMFPKDWQSFLGGRDTEYLKAPSDAVRASIYTSILDIDIAYTPRFDSDRFITGERLSYWNGYRKAGKDSIIQADRPDNWLNDYELAARFSKNINGNEIAVYGYRGYWKSPGGMDPLTFKHIFPRLNVYGASIRGQTGKGIGNIEAGYYDSQDDRSGSNPFVNNSQIRFLAGYEQDLPGISSDLTAGVQYYLEYMMDHSDYLTALPEGMAAADKDRHLLTLRITKLLFNQNLTCSLFTFYSPSDQDFYIRPNLSYKFTDDLRGEVGANIFEGKYPHTFFGQFHENTNVFIAVRYNY